MQQASPLETVVPIRIEVCFLPGWNGVRQPAILLAARGNDMA